MTWLTLAAALTLAPAPPPTSQAPLRIVDRPDVHFMVRPALLVSSDENGVGFTAQLTINVL